MIDLSHQDIQGTTISTDMSSPLEYVISGATVLDGSGSSGARVDVRVVGDRIAQVGQIDASGMTTIDGASRTLAPGFIDSHAHDDFALISHPEMGFKVLGGVTTVVIGNCGMSAAPSEGSEGFKRMLHDGPELPHWSGPAAYLRYLESNAPSVNVAALVGHGTVRTVVMGDLDRAPTASELSTMSDLIDQAMDGGYVGLSTGLAYPPSQFAKTAELVALAKVSAKHGGMYVTHMRDEGYSLLDSIEEAIRIGTIAGLPVVISHLKITGQSNFGKISEALAMIDAAESPVFADQYPYAAGSTRLTAIVSGSIPNAGPEDVVVASTHAHESWHGRTLPDIGSELGVDAEDAGAAILELEPDASVVVHMMDERDVKTVVARRDVMVGSDGVPTLNGKPHPRLYGTFARVLGHYSRREGLLPIEAAVHKMTGLPAAVFGLHARGVIRVGAYADLVLFDSETVLDQGSYADPHHPPVGIDRVWVNGELVVQKGKHIGTRPGRVLIRGG